MRIRKLLLSLVVLLAFAALAKAQTGNAVLLRFVGAPTGSCAPIMVAVNNATGEMFDCLSNAWHSVGGSGGGGTVTSVGQTFTGGLISVAGSPVTTSGTLALTVAGTSGGVPYFDSATSWLSSAALTANSPMLGGGAGVAPSTKTFLTTNGTTTLTVGVAGGGNGAVCLGGNTSGCASLTAPAIAGTVTNPIAISNGITVPGGTASSPSYAFSNNLDSGLFARANTTLDLGLNGATIIEITTGPITRMLSTNVLGWASGAPDATAINIGLSSGGAGVLDVGTGAAANTTGKLKASAYMSVGTKFTASGCSNGTTVGGATVGRFTSGTTGACTVTITMGDTATAPNGWACSASDQTTPANLVSQTTGGSTTTAVITGTTVSGDVLTFSCMGY